MEREPKKETKLKINLLVPIGEIKPEEVSSCFGKLWDISSNDCRQCSDKDACGIIFQKVVDKKVKEVEKQTGSNFLDTVSFKEVTESVIRTNVPNGSKIITLVKVVSGVSKCDDKPSVINFLKEFITSNDWISTKEGKVWIK